MKSLLFLLFGFLCCLMLGCSSEGASTLPGTIDTLRVNTAHEHQYLVFYPGGYDKKKSYPVIFAFDAHAKGSVPMELMKEAANTYGFVVVTSLYVKNGMPDFNKVIGQLVTDVESKVSVNPTTEIYSGFSGGARMAINAGIGAGCAGIIACGASVSYDNIKQILMKTRLYNIAGTQDFNNKESSYAPGAKQCFVKEYYTTTFEGPHQWPTVECIAQAIEYMYVVMEGEGKIEETVDVELIKERLTRQVDSLVEKKDYMRAYTYAERGSKMFADDNSVFAKYMERIVATDDFTSTIAQIEQYQSFEQMICQGYVGSIETESLAWWTKEIIALNDTIAHHTPGAYKDMLLRVKGFIGILCYAKTSNAAVFANEAALEKYLPVYQMIEPENPDMLYYKARYFKIKHNLDSASFYARQAIMHGYEDSSTVVTEFGL